MDDNAINYALLTSGIYGPNPYLTNQGRIPPTAYHGPVTDAMGNVIQPPPGTTLNSAPAAAPAAAPAQPDMMALRNAVMTGQPGAALAYGANFAPQGSPPGIQQMYGQEFAAFTPQQNWAGNTPKAAAPAAAPPDNSYQTALDLLARPGKIETPGATVPQSNLTANQPSVLDQFLAGQRGGVGAGGYSNQGFFDTLNRLRGNPLTGGGSGSSLSPSVTVNPAGWQGGWAANAGRGSAPGFAAAQRRLNKNDRPATS